MQGFLTKRERKICSALLKQFLNFLVACFPELGHTVIEVVPNSLSTDFSSVQSSTNLLLGPAHGVFFLAPLFGRSSGNTCLNSPLDLVMAAISPRIAANKFVSAAG